MSILSAVAAVSPFGPIFGKELRTTARRKRSYLLRVAFLGTLLLALATAWAAQGGRTYGGRAAQAQRQAELGALFFGVFSMFCVTTMGLIGPVLTCTSVGSERLAKTLPVLLMTPINTWQIISGKLFSRLLAALTLLGLSLPVLAVVRLLGGVELEQMIAVLCICTAFALSSAAIGLFFSSMMNRAFAVILLSYGVQGFLYLFVPFVIVTAFERSFNRQIGQLLGILNPFVSTGMQIQPRLLGAFSNDWEWCVAVQLALAAVLVAFSGMLLRRSARTAGERASAVNPENYVPLVAPAAMTAGLNLAPNEEPIAVDAGSIADPEVTPDNRPLLEPQVPGFGRQTMSYAGPALRTSRRGTQNREVSDHPILWRELRRPLLARTWQRVVCVAICIGLLLLTYATLGIGPELSRPSAQIGYAIIFSGIIWLLIAVLSATAIAGEKESDTWTLLLATPVSGSEVVWGKVAGLLRKLVWPMALMTGHFLLFTACGVIEPLSIILILWVTLTFNSVWIATGLWLSLRLKRVTFAVIANLMLAVLVYLLPVVVLAVCSAVFDTSRDLIEHSVWHLPYYYLGNGMDGLNEHLRYGYNAWNNSEQKFILPGDNAATGGEFFGAVLLVGAGYLMVAYIILCTMAADFDRIVGRAGRQAYTGTFDTDDAVMTVESGTRPSFARRGAAMLIDEIILRGGGVVLGALAGFVAVVGQTGAGTDTNSSEQVLASWSLGGLVLSLAVGWLYYAAFESSRRRATPGKAMLGLFVTDGDGRRLTFAKAAARSFGRLVSAVPFFAGYAIAAVSQQRQALHDQMAGTFVLRR